MLKCEAGTSSFRLRSVMVWQSLTSLQKVLFECWGTNLPISHMYFTHGSLFKCRVVGLFNTFQSLFSCDHWRLCYCYIKTFHLGDMIKQAEPMPCCSIWFCCWAIDVDFRGDWRTRLPQYQEQVHFLNLMLQMVCYTEPSWTGAARNCLEKGRH